MKIRCIIADDKPLAIDILKEYISKISFLELVYTSENPLRALEYIHHHPVELIFLDIQMPELNGIQFIKILNGKCKVILTTAYSEYALEGYEHDVVDYLMKPVSFDRFYKAAEKARKQLKPGFVSNELPLKSKEHRPDTNTLFLKTEYKIVSIPIDNILYIEAKQNYIAVVTAKEKVMSLQNIKSIEEKLPTDKFIRVHKSFIVSLNKINSIEKSRIKIEDAIIPIGDSYRAPFFERIGK